ncbi:NUMOD4 domain-containing protein [Cohnella soli]|uniref:NUMOD4 domain-containing protein n=1 Tax=Cohnella soli TaxID=425005 RepID=A0ABW0HVK9_9BACL
MTINKANENQNGSLKDEVWLPVVDYEGIYEVSNYGNIKSLANRLTRKEKTVQTHINQNGYLRVDLYKQGHRKKFSVHRLVAQAFIPNPANKPLVNHRDGVKSKNHVSNLEWCTHSENTSHAFANGLANCVKPVIAINLETNERLEFISQSEASRQLGLNASYILSGKAKRSIGWRLERKIC